MGARKSRKCKRLSGSNKLGLQTNELVLPAKDTAGLFKGTAPQLNEREWMNRLIYGDNLLAMQALLAGDPATGLPSMRGKVDLIYIDPPFDSKADYRTKVTLPRSRSRTKADGDRAVCLRRHMERRYGLIPTDALPRLALMRELLSDKGSIYVHIDWHVGHYVKIILDEIFGKDNLINEIIWPYDTGGKGQLTTTGNTIRFIGMQNQRVIFLIRRERQCQEVLEQRIYDTDLMKIIGNITKIFQLENLANYIVGT